MLIQKPSYIPDILPRLNLKFKWDDWRANEDSSIDPAPYWQRIASTTLRAQTALTIGIYEWIVWRFRQHLPDVEPLLLAEAAWCANVDIAYIDYEEFDREEWLGPLRGPIWCAMTWLMPAVCFSDHDPDEMESGFTYLVRLAFHVVGPETGLQVWLEGAISRFVDLYHSRPLDPFVDLFNEELNERRGPLVPREALDLKAQFAPDLSSTLIDTFLRGVDHRVNPFLRSPDLLISRGFQGLPYRLP